jgi:integrase
MTHSLKIVQTGMRQGELLVLKWEDVDLNEGVIHVRRMLVCSGGRIAIGEPKTKRSRRPVNLTGAAVKALKTHLEQLEDIERLGHLYRDHGLVFTSGVGTLINPTNLRRRSYAPLLERAGLPQIRFHDLRHTCATLLLSRNVHPSTFKISWAMPPWRSRWTPIPTCPGMGTYTAHAMEDVFS